MDSEIFCCDQINSTLSVSAIIQMAEDKIKLFSDSSHEQSKGIELLDHKFTLDLSTSEETLTHCFCLVKKIINIFRVAITAKRSTADRSLWILYRRQIFNFLKSIYRSEIRNSAQFEQFFIKELVNLARFTGRISMLDDFDPNIYVLSVDTQSPSRQYLHVCLDIWLVCFNILSEFNQRNPVKLEILSEVNDSDDSRTKFLECLLADLVYTSLQKFSSTKDLRVLTTMDPYVCPCHRIFYAIIKILVEKDTAILNIHPFWFYFNLIMDNFAEESRKENKDRDSLLTYKRIPSNFKLIENLNLANLWLMSNLMELVDSPKKPGSSQDVCNSAGFSQAIISVLHDYEASGFCKTELIEAALHFCLNAVKRCGICVDIPIPFINCYLKMLTSTNTPNAVFFTLPKSSNQWSLKLRTLFERGTSSEGDDKLLDLLLLLLQKVVSKLFADYSYQNAQLWHKLKGDLFFALSNHPIIEMNENQLYKLLTIIIVCCSASDDRYVDIVEKMVEISKSFKNKALYSKKIKLFIRSTFCAALLLADEKDMNKLISISIDIFDRLAEILSRLDKSNSSSRESCIELILLYFEEMIYLSEVKVESIGNCAPVPQSIVKVYGQLADRDLFNMVASISRMIRSVRIYLPMTIDSLHRHSFGVFLSNILKNFLPFVKAQYGKGPSNQMDLCEVACNLTFLSYFKDSGRLNAAEFRANFFYFTCSSRVDLKQREKFCDSLLEITDKGDWVKEVCNLLSESIDKFFKSDEAGQIRIRTVLLKLIKFIIININNHTQEYFTPKLTELINRHVRGQLMTKLFRLLDIFMKLLPDMKPKLVSTIAQHIHEIELEGSRNTAEIRDALKNFFHSSCLK